MHKVTIFFDKDFFMQPFFAARLHKPCKCDKFLDNFSYQFLPTFSCGAFFERVCERFDNNVQPIFRLESFSVVPGKNS